MKTVHKDPHKAQAFVQRDAVAANQRIAAEAAAARAANPGRQALKPPGFPRHRTYDLNDMLTMERERAERARAEMLANGPRPRPTIVGFV